VKGHTRAVFAVSVMPDGTRIVTGSGDTTSRLWDPAQLRTPPEQPQVSSETRQALIDHAKAVVPRCLTVEQRSTLYLTPKPPGWCIDRGKYPYYTKHWKAWKAGRMADAVDSTTASAYGDFADKALKEGGNFRIGLEAAELGITFDPKKIWILINRAHALMFLDRTEEARHDYLAHRGEILEQGQWEGLILEDFKSLREQGREHPLMTEIEDKFKDSLPANEAHK
jgi:hypothetical protein